MWGVHETGFRFWGYRVGETPKSTYSLRPVHAHNVYIDRPVCVFADFNLTATSYHCLRGLGSVVTD